MNKYMQFAKDLSDQNLLTNNGGPFGAVIVKDNIIVGVGNNHVLKNNDPTAHAEVMAIRDACKNLNTYDLTGCVLYTSCYPCPMCLSAIIWANIKTIYYGNTKEDAADIGFRDDFIYNYIYSLKDEDNKNNTLTTIPMDRDKTIESFNKFKEKFLSCDVNYIKKHTELKTAQINALLSALQNKNIRSMNGMLSVKGIGDLTIQRAFDFIQKYEHGDISYDYLF